MNSQLCNRRSPRWGLDTGATIVIAMLTALPVIGIIAYAVDYSRMIHLKSEMQAFADMAVLSTMAASTRPNVEYLPQPEGESDPIDDLCQNIDDGSGINAIGGDPWGQGEGCEADDPFVLRSLEGVSNPNDFEPIVGNLGEIHALAKEYEGRVDVLLDSLRRDGKEIVKEQLELTTQDGRRIGAIAVDLVDHGLALRGLKEQEDRRTDTDFRTSSADRQRSDRSGGDRADGDREQGFDLGDLVQGGYDVGTVTEFNQAIRSARGATSFMKAAAIGAGSGDSAASSVYGPYSHLNPSNCSALCPDDTRPIISLVEDVPLEQYTVDLAKGWLDEQGYDFTYLSAHRTESGMGLELCVRHQNMLGRMFFEDADICVSSAAVNSSVAMVLSIDRSGSMGGNVPVDLNPEVEELLALVGNPDEVASPKLVAAKIAALGAVDLLGTGDCVAIVSFNEGLQTHFPFTCNPSRSDLQQAIIDIADPEGNTNILQTAEFAKQLFEANPSVLQTHRPVHIVLTDGNANTGAAWQLVREEVLTHTMGAFQELKAMGATVFTVGLGVRCEIGCDEDPYQTRCQFATIRQCFLRHLANAQDIVQQEGDLDFGYPVRPAVSPLDWDDDGVPNTEDNCPLTANPGQENTDGDELGNRCDCHAAFPGPQGSIPNPWPPTWYDVDINSCLHPNDVDYDFVENDQDNCPAHHNRAQTDSDGNGLGDACDLLVASHVEQPMTYAEMAEAGFPVGMAVVNPSLVQFVEIVKNMASQVTSLLVPAESAENGYISNPDQIVAIDTDGFQ